MVTSPEGAGSVTGSGPRRDGLVRALSACREMARAQADDVLDHVPDTGDSATGRAVDDFVEQAADALRALDEAVAETLRRLDALGEDAVGVDEAAADKGAQGRRAGDAYPSFRDRP
ncbi:MAG: hypothetical protein ABJA74_10960 [Lapillicoccus sp.]